jgi:Zn-dependent M16 (insulinase) family peptidase
MPSRPVTLAQWTPQYPPRFEGLTVPSQVNFVAKGANLYELGYKLNGSVLVITNFLRSTWLWDRVRVQGGAYGGFCSFNKQAGFFSYVSYRDPNLLKTLETYDQSASFLRQLDLSEDELTKAIIGAISILDAYQLPDAKGRSSTLRYLIGYTDEDRQRFRDEILTTTAAHFKDFGEVLEEIKEKGLVVVMGSPEAIEAANAEKENWLNVLKVL